jgi:hypothetical protein
VLIFQFSYENPVDKLKDPNCYKFIPVICWRHCLKAIKIENLRGSIEEDTLKKYFSDNTEILESFHYLKRSALPEV